MERGAAMSAWKRRVIGLLAGGILLVALGVVGYHWYMYPYGYHPACARALKLALIQYAGENDGKYPEGEATPEASLSLLYPEYMSGKILAGKSKSGAVADKILKAGGRLGPDTCDWHYVEGLTENDNMEIALFWDKTNIDHNGRRRFDGAHEVFRMWSGSPEYIPAKDWDKFLAEQEELLKERNKRLKDEGK